MTNPARTVVCVLPLLLLAVLAPAPAASSEKPSGKAVPAVGQSPYGPDDERGSLNLMTDESRAAILSRLAGGKVYDLGVEYFVGMPSWHLLGDPRYQFWMTHTPRGTAVDDPARLGRKENELVSYTGDAVSFYTHMGTHIDALNHFGLQGKIYNGWRADEHLGDRGWRKAGAETIPPIIARGVLIDVAGSKGVTPLPASYGITVEDLQQALARQRTKLRRGDVVLIRGGRMKVWPDDSAYVMNQPGLTLPAARWLAEVNQALAIGGDNLSLEHFPVDDGSPTWVPVHTYLLAQAGVPIIEVVDLEALAADKVYEFAFIASSLKLRGASAAPFRPLALPVR